MANGSTHDILIIGGGAAGLMAAIFAARSAPSGARVTVLDGAPRIGAKILVSGGGRCNVTHDVVTPEDYAGSKRNQIAKVLRTFTVESTIDFFRGIGVELKREDTGKLFPVTDSARTVLDALLRAVHDAGAEVRANHRVTAVTYQNDTFTVATEHGEYTAGKLILATGGKSLPKTGSDGLGYNFAQALGHTITDTTPALVPLVLPPKHYLTKLSGLTLDVELSLIAGTGKRLHRQAGSMLLTHFGLTGPAAMDISRHWIAAHAKDTKTQLTANLLPGRPGRPGVPGVPGAAYEQVETHLLEVSQVRGKSAIVTILSDDLPKRLAEAILIHPLEIDSQTPMAQLSKMQRKTLARALTALPLPIVRDRGYLFAEVTAGGVPLDEVDLKSMRSRRCSGLQLCGEILDVDGRIGGYNFQWAWSSGRLAGLAAGTAK